ncbi:50S ribosomal protein L33 [Gemmatimonas aurantiaca]|nr:50S ribosomal protein L33 [Gemmatimonas aurantiaca]
MAKKKGEQRVHIKLKSTESTYVYHTTKNKRNTTDRLELKKYDPILKRHVNFKEER